MNADGNMTMLNQVALDCPECGAPLVLKRSRYKPFYGCSKWRETGCTGSHGAHPDGTPMGTPATGAVKRARRRAHAAFDRLWQTGRMRRNQAYAWLSGQMGLSSEQAHIGRFDEAQCDRVVALVVELLGPEVE